MTHNSSHIKLENKIEQPFGWLPQDIIDGKYELSAKAVGILLYLNNRPANWQFHKTEIINRFNDGEHSIRTGLEELRDADFLEIKQLRNNKGQITGTEWIIKLPGKSTAGKPNPGRPNAGKSQTNKTNNNKTNSKRILYYKRRSKG